MKDSHIYSKANISLKLTDTFQTFIYTRFKMIQASLNSFFPENIKFGFFHLIYHYMKKVGKACE